MVSNVSRTLGDTHTFVTLALFFVVFMRWEQQMTGILLKIETVHPFSIRAKERIWMRLPVCVRHDYLMNSKET